MRSAVPHERRFVGRSNPPAPGLLHPPFYHSTHPSCQCAILLHPSVSPAVRSSAPDPAPLLGSAHDTAEGAAAAAAAESVSVKLQDAVAKAEAKRSSPASSAEAIGASVPAESDSSEVNQPRAAPREEEATAVLQQGISAAAEVLQQAAEPVVPPAPVPAAEPHAALVDVQPVAASTEPVPAATPAMEQQQPAKQPAKSQSQKRGGSKKKGRGGRK